MEDDKVKCKEKYKHCINLRIERRGANGRYVECKEKYKHNINYFLWQLREEEDIKDDNVEYNEKNKDNIN